MRFTSCLDHNPKTSLCFADKRAEGIMRLARKTWTHCCPLILFACAVGLSNAQSHALHRNVLTNRDIVTLAKAGFDEEFLIKIIQSSHKQFDTAPDALAALAEQGITQRIVEVMMSPEPAIPPPMVAAPPAPSPVAKTGKRA